MNKKGNIVDILYLGVIIFTFAILTIIGGKILGDVKDQFNSTVGIENSTIERMNMFEEKYTPTFDGLFIFILGALSVVVILSAFFVRTHPAFYFIAVIAMILFIFINAILGYGFNKIATAEEFIEVANEFTVMNFVMGNFPVIMLLISFVIIIVLFSKGGDF